MRAWRACRQDRGMGISFLTVVMSLGLLGVLGIPGCTSKHPSPPSPTKQEVMSDSDRFFEKMKEDELRHGKGTGPDLR